MPAGTYDLQISVEGVGPVYGSGAYVVDSDETLTVVVPEAQKPVLVSGTVVATGTTTGISDAFVEIRNTDTKRITGAKTDSDGTFSLTVKAGASIEYIVKKPGYLPSEVLTATVGESGLDLENIELSSVDTGTSITVSGTLIRSDTFAPLSTENAFVSLRGVNASGDDTSLWHGQGLTLSDGAFSLADVPENF